VSAALVITKAPAGATLQDGGRFGWLRYGVTPAGAMDLAALKLACRLAGHRGVSAAIEVGLGGIEVEATDGAVGLGIAGGAFTVQRDGETIPTPAAIVLQAGSRLTIRAGQNGAWTYVAPAAPFDVAPVMGSLATHTRALLGPLGGGLLMPRTRLPLVHDPRPAVVEGTTGLPAALEPVAHGAATIRVVLGPQDDRFTAKGLATLVEATFQLSARSDRMAWRLEGPRLEHSAGHDIVSDGIALGSIQVPGDGQPLVLMADRQPTGGYPKIATVIRADLGRLAQVRPGGAIRFETVSTEAAVEALRAVEDQITAAVSAIRPLGAALDLAALATGDHASGIISASDTGP
jgi:biotin-dependent carboxylase-like uncharacterized protein